jgi:hypothetical protein
LSEGVAEDRVGQFVGFVNFAKNLIYYLNSWIRIPVQNASYKSQPLEPGRSPPSSSALCAFEGHAPKRPHGFSPLALCPRILDGIDRTSATVFLKSTRISALKDS